MKYREHIPREDSKAYCGRKNVILLNVDWYDRSIDYNNVCKDCFKIKGLPEDYFDFEAMVHSEYDDIMIEVLL